MSDLTYKPAKKAKRQFRVGDTVDVLDREHAVISQRKIVSVGLQLAVTDCGRKWCIYDGARWANKRAWPFPSIRHAQ